MSSALLSAAKEYVAEEKPEFKKPEFDILPVGRTDLEISKISFDKDKDFVEWKEKQIDGSWVVTSKRLLYSYVGRDKPYIIPESVHKEILGKIKEYPEMKKISIIKSGSGKLTRYEVNLLP